MAKVNLSVKLGRHVANSCYNITSLGRIGVNCLYAFLKNEFVSVAEMYGLNAAQFIHYPDEPEPPLRKLKMSQII